MSYVLIHQTEFRQVLLRLRYITKITRSNELICAMYVPTDSLYQLSKLLEERAFSLASYNIYVHKAPLLNANFARG